MSNVHSSILKHALKHPQKLAVKDSEVSFTFSELDRFSSEIANYLIEKKVEPRDCVSVLVQNKSANILPLLLGILKSGAYYLPIDPKNPEDRVLSILADASPKILIANEDSNLCGSWNNLSYEFILNLRYREQSNSEISLPFVNPEEIAYCLYTSGTTGKPKGSLIQHKSVLSFFSDMNQILNITSNSSCMNTSPFYFDVSIADTFLPLSEGASVYITDKFLSPPLIMTILQKEKITHFCAVSSILSLLSLCVGMLSECYLEKIMSGAEILDVKAINKWIDKVPNIEIINGYGPTEATCVCVAYTIKKSNVDLFASFPIGKPLKNVQAELIDNDGNVVDIGKGELVIGGDQIMKEYWNRPNENKKVFIILNKQRFYKTGDICSRDQNKLFHFIGRKDEEVKFRGYRINLNEILITIQSNSQVSEVLVSVLKNEENNEIVCAVVPKDRSQFDLISLNHFLSKQLPEYMIPSKYLIFDAFPKLGSGKINKKSIEDEFAFLLKSKSSKVLTLEGVC